MSKGDYFFPLYYQRLLTSTTGWKDDEFGAYMKLLIYQFDNGSIPNDMEAISRISATAKKRWNLIGKKFVLNESGEYINLVMDSIRNKRLNKAIVNQKNGQKGGRKKTQKEPTGLELGNPNYNPNESNTNMVTGLLDSGYSEGGTGETEFTGNWDSVKFQFLQHTEWMTTFCTSKNLTAKQFDAIAKDFTTDLELKEDYKTLKDLKSHFTNWFNKGKDKILADLPAKKNGLSAREIEEKKNREKLGIND